MRCCCLIPPIIALIPFLLRPAAAQALSPPALVTMRALAVNTDGIPGALPRLLQCSNGFLYGSGPGGANNVGTVYRVSLDGRTFSVIRNDFGPGLVAPSSLLESRDGRLYGVAGVSGVVNVADAIFSMNLDGSGFVVIRQFNSLSNGAVMSPLLEATDGRLYGATTVGALAGGGAIFRINRDGSGYQLLRSLVPATDGSYCQGGLLQGPDGRLYGTAVNGGASAGGTIFRLNPDGSSFAVLRHLAPADGIRPYGPLCLARDGRLYGVAQGGGAHARGSIFSLNLDGSGFTVVYAFRELEVGYTLAGVVQGADDALYGSVPMGGVTNSGRLFRFRPSDQSFSLLTDLVDGAQGNAPYGTLIFGHDRRLYGLTTGGGPLQRGTIFAYSLAPQLFSPNTATGTVGRPFLYRIGATDPTGGYLASGLPPGTTLDVVTGDVAGTPTRAGSYAVTVGAGNPHGTTTGTLTIAIAKGTATLGLSALTRVFDGTPQPVQVSASPAGLPLVVTYNGSTTPPTSAGTYSVVATVANDPNYVGTVTGTLTIAVQPPQLSPPSAPLPVIAGTSTTLRATAFGSPPLIFRWQRRPAGSAEFSDLFDGPGYSGTGSTELVVLAPTLAMNGDAFRVTVTNPAATVFGETLPMVVLPAARLRNVSIRAAVRTTEPLVVGFGVNADVPQLLIRAVGPGLAPFLGNAALAGNPSLALYGGSANPTAANDDWGGTPTLIVAFNAAGAFPLSSSSADAALLVDVAGSRTAQMRVTSPGAGLVEIYDTSSDPARRIVNLSARHLVNGGSDPLVAGFVVGGTGPTTLLVRGIGPALRAFGVTGALPDPAIAVFDAAARRVGGNENWDAALRPVFAEVAAFALPDGSRDAALILTVQPGAYTVQLSSADGASGDGLIELYELLR